MIKNLPADVGDVRDCVQSLGLEDALEEEMATHSKILSGKIPWTEEPSGLQSMGSQRIRHNLATKHISVQFSSVAQSCLTLCDPMDCSTPGLPVHHQPLEFTPTHVHQVGDAIKPSHPLLSPSPPAFNLSQHQGLFK